MGWTPPQRFRKSKIAKTAAAVAAAFVGIGLLAGSLSLLAEPVQTGPFPGQITNVCAPVVSSVTVTDDGSAGLRVSVSLSHDGWDMFRRWFHPSETGFSRSVFRGYRFLTYDAVRHDPFRRGLFYYDDGLRMMRVETFILIILLVAAPAANTSL